MIDTSCVLQTVVIDAHGHMLGRLTSIIAKQLLSGQQIVSLSTFALGCLSHLHAVIMIYLMPDSNGIKLWCLLYPHWWHSSFGIFKACWTLRRGYTASTPGEDALWMIRAMQVVVRCEEACISGGIVRQKAKYERFLRKRMNTQPTKGPIHYRAPSRIMWRTVRGYATLLHSDLPPPINVDGEDCNSVAYSSWQRLSLLSLVSKADSLLRHINNAFGIHQTMPLYLF